MTRSIEAAEGLLADPHLHGILAKAGKLVVHGRAVQNRNLQAELLRQAAAHAVEFRSLSSVKAE
tara:strand:+ start:666 stop:857 length:192 start_codon:yes stop_codon:yes gene_type:complete